MQKKELIAIMTACLYVAHDRVQNKEEHAFAIGKAVGLAEDIYDEVFHEVEQA